MQGLAPNSAGGLYVHSGTTCQSVDGPGAHLYSTARDPWGKDTQYLTDFSGSAYGSFVVDSGVRLDDLEGHVVIVHDKNDQPVGCGLLLGFDDGTDGAIAATTTPPRPTPVPEVADDAEEQSEEQDKSAEEEEDLSAPTNATAADGPLVSLDSHSSVDGNTSVFVVTITNIASTAITDVVVQATLPPEAAFASAEPAADYTPANGLWLVGRLPVQGSKSLVIVAAAEEEGAGEKATFAPFLVAAVAESERDEPTEEVPLAGVARAEDDGFSFEIWHIVLMALGGLIIVCSATFAICWCRNRESRAKSDSFDLSKNHDIERLEDRQSLFV